MSSLSLTTVYEQTSWWQNNFVLATHHEPEAIVCFNLDAAFGIMDVVVGGVQCEQRRSCAKLKTPTPLPLQKYRVDEKMIIQTEQS